MNSNILNGNLMKIKYFPFSILSPVSVTNAMGGTNECTGWVYDKSFYKFLFAKIIAKLNCINQNFIDQLDVLVREVQFGVEWNGKIDVIRFFLLSFDDSVLI